MIKLQSFLLRRGGMTHEAFREYWLTEHVPLTTALDGLRGYRTAVPVRPEGGGYDGIAELYFDTVADFEAVLGPDSDTPAIRDVSNFESASDRCVVTETVAFDDFGDGRRSAKLVAVVARADGRSHEAFVDDWLDDVDPEAVPSLRKYTTAVPVDPATADYDGVVECYFSDEAALAGAVGGDLDRATALDGPVGAAVPTAEGLVDEVGVHLVEEIVQVPLGE